jgi:hypothetical protein
MRERIRVEGCGRRVVWRVMKWVWDVVVVVIVVVDVLLCLEDGWYENLVEAWRGVLMYTVQSSFTNHLHSCCWST